MPCEDAPCCGCCGTSLYGTEQGDEGPSYCDACGFNHFGDCEDWYEDQDDDAPDEDEDDD